MFNFSIKRMAAVTKKEFRELIRNWKGFLLSIIAPLMLFFLMAYGFPLDVKNVPMVILDEDKSNISRNLIDEFNNSGIFDVKGLVENHDEMDRVIRAGEIKACVVIPRGFSRDMTKGRPQSLQVLIDAMYPNRAAIIGGYVDMAIDSFNYKILNIFLDKKTKVSNRRDIPVTIFISPWFNPTLRSEDFIIPGIMAIILVFFPPIVAAISVTKEKETGSILNMYCSPVTKAEYLIGKMIPHIVLAYFNFLLYLFFALKIFHVPLNGSPLLLLAVTLIYVVTIMGIGLFVAILVNTQIAAIIIVGIIAFVLTFMYSGFMLPVICLDENARAVAGVLPPTYYMDFIRKLMIKGIGLNYLWHDITALVFIGFSLYAASIIIFKKKI